MSKSNATLREVGTTNRTRIDDYERAINERTRLLLRVHRSNFESRDSPSSLGSKNWSLSRYAAICRSWKIWEAARCSICGRWESTANRECSTACAWASTLSLTVAISFLADRKRD